MGNSNSSVCPYFEIARQSIGEFDIKCVDGFFNKITIPLEENTSCIGVDFINYKEFQVSNHKCLFVYVCIQTPSHTIILTF